MLALTNANPDYYRGNVVMNGRETCMLYSTLDLLQIGQNSAMAADIDQIPADRDVIVQALNVMVFGNLRIPSGNLTIRCKSLTFIGVGEENKLMSVLDVSPPDLGIEYRQPFATQALEMSNDPVVYGAHGDDIAQRMQEGKGHACEGATPGIAYQYGKANDAKAGSITIICDSLTLKTPLILKATGGLGYPGCNGQVASPGKTGHRGGVGGNGGTGGAGGEGGTVSLRYRSATGVELVSADATGGDGGAAGLPGSGGTDRGDEGGTGRRGLAGAPGTVFTNPATELSEFGHELDEIFFLKLLQKTRLTFLANQPVTDRAGRVRLPPDPAWSDLGETIGWLSGALQDFVTKERGTTVEQRKFGIVSTASKLGVNHTNGFTYFGKDANWVPVTTYPKMEELLGARLTVMSGVEKSFLNLSSEFASRESAQQALSTARQELQIAVDVHESIYLSIQDQLTDELAPLIAQRGATVAAMALPLRDSLIEFKERVTAALKCSTENLLKAAEMMVFSLGEEGMFAAMGLVEGATLLNTAFKEIPDDTGKTIPKSEIIEKVAVITGDLLEEGRGELVDADGQITSDKKVLLTTLAQLEEQVKKLKGSIGEEHVMRVTQHIDAFRDAVLKKAEAVLDYMAGRLRLADEFNAYQTARAEAAEKAALPDLTSPEWVGTVARYAKLYQDQIMASAEAMALVQSKLTYVTLGANVTISPTAGLSTAWLDGAAVTQIDVPALKTRLLTYKETFTDYQSGSRAPDKPLPALATARSSLMAHIPAGHPFIAALKKDRTITLKLVPYSKKTLAADEFHVADSEGYYDIRINAVNARVFGLAHTDATKKFAHVQVHISPECVLIDSTKKVHEFKFERARDASHNLRIDTDPAATDDNDIGSAGGMDGSFASEFLDMPGLFATYTLSIPRGHDEDTNAGLVLDGITDVRIYFKAVARSHGT